MKTMTALAFSACAAAAFADPSVTIDTIAQTGRTVTVCYTLSNEPAVITFGVETNAGNGLWLPVGGSQVRRVAGKVNRRMATGSYSFKWIADENWLAEAVGAGEARAVVRAWALDNPPDYVMFNLMGFTTTSKHHSVLFYESLDHFPFPISDDRYKRYWYVMRRIPAKDVVWRMGSPTGESGRQSGETPHYVKLTQDYYIGVYLFSEAHYAQYTTIHEQKDYGSGKVMTSPTQAARGYMGYNNVRGSAEDYVWPESGHSVDPDKILGKLRAAFPGYDFDLATSAQWEFACRAGTGTRYYWGDAAANLSDPDDVFFQYAWKTYVNVEVGLKKPNAFGLYDMIGLTREICLDWFETKYAEASDPEHPIEDPKGPATADHASNLRTPRGVSSTAETYMRTAMRLWDEAPSRNAGDTGLRPVIPAVVP